MAQLEKFASRDIKDVYLYIHVITDLIKTDYSCHKMFLQSYELDSPYKIHCTVFSNYIKQQRHSFHCPQMAKIMQAFQYLGSTKWSPFFILSDSFVKKNELNTWLFLTSWSIA